MLIVARYASTCLGCGKSVPAGGSIHWERGVVRCLNCKPEAVEARIRRDLEQNANQPSDSRARSMYKPTRSEYQPERTTRRKRKIRRA